MTIPGALLIPIVLGDRIGLALQLLRSAAAPSLLTVCGRLASANGQVDIVRSLLEKGFPATDPEALKCSAAAGWTGVIKCLRAHGAKLESVAHEMVVAAARAGHLDTLQYLHRHGCSLAPCVGLLAELASKPSRKPVFAYLAANGIFPNAQDLASALDAVKEGNLGAFSHAIANLDVEAVAPLLLRTVGANGSVECLKRLEQQGLSLEQHGNHALLAAAQAGHCEAVDYMVKRGFPDKVSLVEAARLSLELGHARVAECLSQAGHVLNDVPAETLQLAAINGRSKMNARLRRQQRVSCESRAAAVPARNTPPTVSLLLANYNDGVFLRTSLQAIFAQTRLADEIIIVDDGSTDDSIEIIERFMSLCPGVRLLKHERNLGQHAAIQRALVEAKSDYIVWASSDDLLLPRFLEKAVDTLSAHPGVGLCFSKLCAWREGTRVVREFDEGEDPAFDLGTEVHRYSPGELRERLRRSYLWMSGNTVVTRRDALLAIGGFESRLRWHADWFAFYAVALRHGACSIPQTLAIMRERDQTYSRDGMVDAKAQRAVLRAIIDVLMDPENRDLYKIFRERPTLLSPFGSPMLAANAFRPKTWPLMMPFFFWLFPRKLRLLLNTARRKIRRAVKLTLFAVARRIPNKRVRTLIGTMIGWYSYKERQQTIALAARIAAEQEAGESNHSARYS